MCPVSFRGLPYRPGCLPCRSWSFHISHKTSCQQDSPLYRPEGSLCRPESLLCWPEDLMCQPGAFFNCQRASYISQSASLVGQRVSHIGWRACCARAWASRIGQRASFIGMRVSCINQKKVTRPPVSVMGSHMCPSGHDACCSDATVIYQLFRIALSPFPGVSR